MKTFDFALAGFQEKHKCIEDESESNGKDNCNNLFQLCYESFPQRYPCFANTLQLGLGDCFPRLKHTVTKASQHCVFFFTKICGSKKNIGRKKHVQTSSQMKLSASHV